MSCIRMLLIVAAVPALCNCAVNENTYWHVTDSTMYWNRVGYSVTGPSGPNWYKQPRNEKNPNAIAFYKGEGLVVKEAPEKVVYIQGTLVVVEGMFLPAPIPPKDGIPVLQKYLDNYSLHSAMKVDASSYDKSLGYDCLRYSGSYKPKRIPTEMGEMHVDEVTGYFCLHPQVADFAVLMESRSMATMGIPTKKNDQPEHLFRSLRFTPISSAARERMKKRK